LQCDHAAWTRGLVGVIKTTRRALFLAAMAWGFGTTNVRWPRQAAMLVGQDNEPKLAEIIRQVRENGAGDGWSSLWGDNHVDGFGAAFGTKLLYFAGYRGKLRPRPLVKVAAVRRALTLCWDDIAPLLRPATVAVVVAHLRGFPDPDVAVIAGELLRVGIPLIEDCAQAWGVRVTPKRAGGSYGAVAVFSLQHCKLVTAGEGGLVVADDVDLMTRMRVLTGHNKIPVSQPVWRGNARMTEVTAALAVPQLRKLDQLVRDLQALQRQVVTELTEESVADRVVPDAGDLEWHGLGAAAVVFKPYPCNHFTHAGVDAALRAAPRGSPPPTSQRSSWASPSPSCARSPSHPRPRHGRPPGTTRRSAAPTRSPRRCSAAARRVPRGLHRRRRP
jgi:hypothetical protein